MPASGKRSAVEAGSWHVAPGNEVVVNVRASTKSTRSHLIDQLIRCLDDLAKGKRVRLRNIVNGGGWLLFESIGRVDFDTRSVVAFAVESAATQMNRWFAIEWNSALFRFYWCSKPKTWQDLGRMEEKDYIDLSGQFRNRIAELDAGVSAAAMVADKVKPFTEEDIKAIERMIEDAQRRAPEDKSAFVRDINLLLDLSQCRIQLVDGTLARLTVVPGSSKRGYLQFSVTGGTRGGFRKAPIHIVRVPSEARKYGLRTATP